MTVPIERLTPEQVAAELQVNRNSVYRWIRRRQLRAERAGRLRRIKRSDLEAFLSRGRR